MSPEFRPWTYGESFADVYDEWYQHVSDVDSTAAFVISRLPALNERTRSTLLELGVGSGRLLPPLLTSGLRVLGVDASASMLERCRPRFSKSDVSLVRADFAQLPIAPNTADGALCAFNTLFNLVTAPEQQQFFSCAASVLRPNAPLVVEAITFVEAEAAVAESSLGVSRIETDRLVLTASQVDAELQTITGQHVDITGAGIRLRPWKLRWATPAQLDQMALAVGFELAERFEDWDLTPFSAHSERHVSVYRTPG